MGFPIYDFTEPELKFFRENCNFSQDELDYFNLRAKHYSNLQIAIEMNVSENNSCCPCSAPTTIQILNTDDAEATLTNANVVVTKVV